MSPSFTVVGLLKQQHSAKADQFATVPEPDSSQTLQKVRKLSADYLLGMAAEIRWG